MTILRWLVAIFVIVGLISGLGYFKFSRISAAIAAAESFPEHSEVTEAVETSHSQFSPRLSVLGDVLNPEHILLRSQRAGQISKLGFVAGETVTAGQMLVQLDISEEQARLDGAKADVELARLVMKRAEKLRKSGSLAQSKLDQERANLKKAKSAVAIIESTIDQKTIRAPFSGRTNTGSLKVGQYINIGDQITELVGARSIRWLDFTLPQGFYDFPDGASFIVHLPDGTRLKATLIAVNQSVAQQSRTRKYRVAFDVGDKDIIHGSSLLVSVPSGAPTQIIDLPITALRSDAYGQFVYLLEPAEQESTYRAKRQQVSNVTYRNDRALIGTGLEPNHLVATNGSFKLYPGILTRLVDKLPQTPNADKQW